MPERHKSVPHTHDCGGWVPPGEIAKKGRAVAGAVAEAAEAAKAAKAAAAKVDADETAKARRTVGGPHCIFFSDVVKLVKVFNTFAEINLPDTGVPTR